MLIGEADLCMCNGARVAISIVGTYNFTLASEILLDFDNCF